MELERKLRRDRLAQQAARRMSDDDLIEIHRNKLFGWWPSDQDWRWDAATGELLNRGALDDGY